MPAHSLGILGGLVRLSKVCVVLCIYIEAKSETVRSWYKCFSVNHMDTTANATAMVETDDKRKPDRPYAISTAGGGK